MLEVILDTETTGLDYNQGDKIIEIGCVEIDNFVPTGKIYQTYINPKCIVSEEAIKIHGITNEFLKDKPIFKDIADEFLEFIGNKPIVAHNGIKFDIPFLNFELTKAGYTKLSNKIVDTLLLAREINKYNNSLDELCKKYNIDYSMRTEHGALLDAKLLSEVYNHLIKQHEEN